MLEMAIVDACRLIDVGNVIAWIKPSGIWRITKLEEDRFRLTHEATEGDSRRIQAALNSVVNLRLDRLTRLIYGEDMASDE